MSITALDQGKFSNAHFRRTRAQSCIVNVVVSLSHFVLLPVAFYDVRSGVVIIISTMSHLGTVKSSHTVLMLVII